MDKATIIEVLEQWNLWDREMDTGVPRVRYIKKIYPYLDRKEVLVLKGIRRSGKSTHNAAVRVCGNGQLSTPHFTVQVSTARHSSVFDSPENVAYSFLSSQHPFICSSACGTRCEPIQS